MERLIAVLVVAGGLLILVQAFWISWGVFTRYVLRNPDAMVTEATALLLVPLAFVGLAYALQCDSFPKVTLLVERLPRRWQHWVAAMNLALMAAIGVFLTLVSSSAARRTHASGAASDNLEWPEFLFWIPVAICIAAFTLLAFIKLARLLVEQR